MSFLYCAFVAIIHSDERLGLGEVLCTDMLNSFYVAILLVTVVN